VYTRGQKNPKNSNAFISDYFGSGGRETDEYATLVWICAERCIVLQIKTTLLKTATVYTGYTRRVTVTEIDVASSAYICKLYICVCLLCIMYKCEAHAATGFFRITGARTEPIFQIIVRTGPILAANRPTFNSVTQPPPPCSKHINPCNPAETDGSGSTAKYIHAQTLLNDILLRIYIVLGKSQKPHLSRR
jgi:hypothetical protein